MVCKLSLTEIKHIFEEALTMANYNIEIERNNVTLAQFLRYVRQQCERKNIDFGVERDFLKIRTGARAAATW